MSLCKEVVLIDNNPMFMLLNKDMNILISIIIRLISLLMGDRGGLVGIKIIIELLLDTNKNKSKT